MHSHSQSPSCTCTQRLMVCKSFKMLCNENFTYGFTEDQELGTESLTCWHRRWQPGSLSPGRRFPLQVPWSTCTLMVMTCQEPMRLGKKVPLSGCQRCVPVTSTISKSRVFFFFPSSPICVYASIFETVKQFVDICTAVYSVRGLSNNLTGARIISECSCH